MVLVQEIADYQLRELAEKKIYINKYDLSLKYNYELEPYWKALFYDIAYALYKKNGSLYCKSSEDKKDLFVYLQKNYEQLIKDNRLPIDVRDYVEINDYITFDEWRLHPNAEIKFVNEKILLVEFQ